MNIQEVLTPQEIQQYKAQGYTEQDIQIALNQAHAEQSKLQQSYAQVQQQRQTDPRARSSNTLVASGYNDNLIQWQLELDTILERIEHMLRGDKPTWESGSVVWKPPIDDKEKILNDFGVAEIMRVLSNYVNRNTILSNYKEEVINEKMFDLGNELADLFFLKYEAMGLNSLEKRKLYPIICRELVDVVHSSYLRALHGGERESLREARQVTQTDNAMGNTIINTQPQMRTRGILNPMRYVMGKFK